MKYLKHLALVGLLLGCSSDAGHGPSHHIVFDYDGIVLVVSFAIHCGLSSRVYSTIKTIPADIRQYPIPDLTLPDGENFCAMTATSFTGGTSDYSNEVSFYTVSGALVDQAQTPNPPTNVRIE